MGDAEWCDRQTVKDQKVNHSSMMNAMRNDTKMGPGLSNSD